MHAPYVRVPPELTDPTQVYDAHRADPFRCLPAACSHQLRAVLLPARREPDADTRLLADAPRVVARR